LPTIFTHALLPLIGAAALNGRIPGRLVAAGMVAAVLPDADVAARIFGIPHTHDFGHRGATHTILFALIVGLTGAAAAQRLRSGPWLAFLFLSLSTLSHAFTDMVTNGGKGLMLLWPLSGERFASLWRPVEVSRVGLQAFDEGRIWTVLLSEWLWLVLPAAAFALLLRLSFFRRRKLPAAIDSAAAHP
jgi:inner membrane protein